MQIEVKHLIKEYQRKKNPSTIGKAITGMFHPQYEVFRAVDDVSFSISKGESIGYVGPNGSGKSTTIKMLSGVLIPTSGQVLINGLEPSKNRTKINKNIGAVFGNRSVLWWNVPIIESYKVLKRLYEIPEKTFRDNLSQFTEILEMKKILEIPERQLSLGQKMKCNIAAAFLHNPEIVYLDEPTIGLDSESKLKIRTFIQKMNEERKTTFIVTSHDFQDIESVCKRIILINRGQIVLDGEIGQVRKKFNNKRKIVFEMENNPWLNKKENEIFGAQIEKISPTSLVLEYDLRVTDSMNIIKEVASQCIIKDVSIGGQDIESIIREIVRKDNDKKLKL